VLLETSEVKVAGKVLEFCVARVEGSGEATGKAGPFKASCGLLVDVFPQSSSGVVLRLRFEGGKAFYRLDLKWPEVGVASEGEPAVG